MPKLIENYYTNKIFSKQDLEAKWLESLQKQVEEAYKIAKESQKKLGEQKLILRPMLEKKEVKNKCNHYWTKTRGLNKDYYDCKFCSIKYEDFSKQTGRVLAKEDLENKNFIPEYKIVTPKDSNNIEEQPDIFNNLDLDELEDFGYWEDDIDEGISD